MYKNLLFYPKNYRINISPEPRPCEAAYAAFPAAGAASFPLLRGVFFAQKSSGARGFLIIAVHFPKIRYLWPKLRLLTKSSFSLKMKYIVPFLLALSVFIACKNNPNAALSDEAAITNTLRQFYKWYNQFVTDARYNINFVNTDGAYAQLDSARLEQYFNNLKASGALSDAYFQAERLRLRESARLWKNENKDDILSGMENEPFFCAQDWDIDQWNAAPIQIQASGADRATAQLSSLGENLEMRVEMVKENGKWLIARVVCPQAASVDYTGNYRSSDKSCNATLSISATNGKYQYQFQIGKRKRSGTLDISETDGQTYLTFNGLISASHNETVEGVFTDDAVIIQNTGNASNPFTRFRECDAKYLTLEKTAAGATTVPPTPNPVAPEKAAEKPAATQAPAKKSNTKPLPAVTINRKGDITLSGKKTSLENLKKELQTALAAYPVLPTELRLQSIGEVGMGMRQELQTRINEAIAGARWVRKKAALETLNAPVGKKLGAITRLEVLNYQTSGAFALLEAKPWLSNGAAINYAKTPYAAEYQAGTFAEKAIGLLEYEGGKWQVLVYTLGSAQAPKDAWVKKYGAPRALFGK
jgi:hypothetical protein